jgi:hypothetical protein
MSASKRNTAHYGFGKPTGASGGCMNGHACLIPALPAHAAAGAAELGWFAPSLEHAPAGIAGRAQFVSCSMSMLIGK